MEKVGPHPQPLSYGERGAGEGDNAWLDRDNSLSTFLSPKGHLD